MSVLVLDKTGKPLMPCSEKRARLHVSRGRARIHRRLPFVIRLVDRLQADCVLQPVTVKIDPGSQVTGMALVRQHSHRIAVLSLIELVHRGAAIKKTLQQRANFRRRRRSAHLRHRAPRFDNRTRREGWLPPSRHNIGWRRR